MLELICEECFKIKKQLPVFFFGFILFVFLSSFFLPLSSKAVNNIFYVGLALPAVIWMLRDSRNLPVIFRRYSVFIGLFVGFLALAAVADPPSMKKVFYVFLYFITCLLIAQKEGAARAVFGAYSVVACVIFLYSVIDWFWQYHMMGVWNRQVFFGGSANPVYASLLILSALVFVWLFYLEGFLLRRSKLHLFVGMFLLVGASLLCVLVFQARSALLGALLFFVVYLMQRRFVLLGVVVALISGGVVYLLGVGHLLIERGISFRAGIWADALHHLTSKCSIWIGCGADEYVFLGQFQHPHSGYVSTLYRSGFIGAGMFMLFALVFFVRGWKSSSPWFLLALIGWGGLLTTGTGFFSSPQPLWVYFWFPTLMALLDTASLDRNGLMLKNP